MSLKAYIEKNIVFVDTEQELSFEGNIRYKGKYRQHR